MSESSTDSSFRPQFLAIDRLQTLIDALVGLGYQVVGPTIEQEAIVYDQITAVEDLPRGWTDVQEPGKYRLQRHNDEALFGYVVGPHSWKKFLFPPLAKVLTADRTESGWQMHPRKKRRRGTRFSASEHVNWLRSPCRIELFSVAIMSIRFTRLGERPFFSWRSTALRQQALAFAHQWQPGHAAPPATISR